MKKKFTKEEIKKLKLTRTTLLANLDAKSTMNIHGNTYWEELMCVGFNPQLTQLEAVISVKRSTGYSGGLCSNGSTEYIRFFIDWGDGNGFQDVGLTSFKAYDISNAPPGPQHPLKYMVYLPLDDDDYKKYCTVAVLPKVRAMLSWNKIPSLNPNDNPHFGNKLDAAIQIEPGAFTILGLIKEGLIEKNLSILDNLDLEAFIPKSQPIPVPWSQLMPIYKKAKVPDHRLTYDAVYPMVKSVEGLSMSAAQKDFYKVKELKINVGKVAETLAASTGNKTYEEVVCVGLNSASDMLGAVIHIKKPCGYSGNLCQPGSKEYVAFWADWDNNGSYDNYLGTTSVDVHDIHSIPSDGLYYSVLMPGNFSQHLKSCHHPNIVRIRAVLSWAIPPSTTDPNDLNYWSNRKDVVVQVRPGAPTTGLVDLIYDIGNVAVENISPVSFLANPSTGILNPSICNQAAMDRPFGGMVRIGGRIYNTGTPGSVYYQVQYKQKGSTNWLPVTHSHRYKLMHPHPADPNYPFEKINYNSADGWFPYLEDPLAQYPILESTSCLARWSTGSLNGTYDLRLIYTKDYPITSTSVIHYSQIKTIVLDNTGFSVDKYNANPAVDPNFRLDIVIDGGDCHNYKQGTKILGHLRAIDSYFWKWRLDLQPTTHTNGVIASPSCRSYSSLSDHGDGNAAWSLETKNLDPCGYTLTLWAYDRTIVNSNGAIVHLARKAVGFSIK